MRREEIFYASIVAFIVSAIFLLFNFKIIDSQLVKVILTLQDGTRNDISIMYFYNGAKDGEYVFGGEGKQVQGSIISEDPVQIEYNISRQGAKSIRFDLNKAYETGNIVKVSKIEMNFLGFWKILSFNGKDIADRFNGHNIKITQADNVASLEVAGKDPYFECFNVNSKWINHLSIYYIIGSIILGSVIFIILFCAIKKGVLPQVVLISGFIISITYALLIGQDKDISSFFENRNLANKPQFSINNIFYGSYTDEFTNFYNDHIPMRKLATRINSTIQYFLFHSSIDERVEPGKDGWLLFKSEGNENALTDYTGGDLFTDSKLKHYSESLMGLRNYLADKNIKLYIIIPPNKSQIYSEYVPDKYLKAAISPGDQITRYLTANTDLNIVNVKPILLQEKKDYLLHWNSIGAYFAFSQLMDAIDPNFVPKPIEELSPTYLDSNYSDLTRLLNIGSLTKNTWASVTYKPDITYELTEEMHYQGYDSSYLYKSTINNQKKLLMYRDSYADAMIPFLNKEFSSARYIFGDHLTEKLIQNESPSVVVIEMLERTLHNRLNQLEKWNKYYKS